MIYILGMSHAVNVLKACASESLAMSLEEWNSLGATSHFIDVNLKQGLLPVETLKAFLISPATGWGKVASTVSEGGASSKLLVETKFLNLLASIEHLQADGTIFTFINGNEHAGLSMTECAVPFDFVLPGREDLPLLANRQIVPYDVVHRQVELVLNPTIAILISLRKYLPSIRILYVTPPPSVASEEQIQKSPEIFASQITKSGITPLSLRLKYYLLYTEIIKRALAPLGIEMLPPPAEALNDDGSLRDEFVHGSTHGNLAYAGMVVRQMNEILKTGDC